MADSIVTLWTHFLNNINGTYLDMETAACLILLQYIYEDISNETHLNTILREAAVTSKNM
jgi:hypothetical protein